MSCIRTEGLAERRRAHSADHARLEVQVHRAGDVLSARGLVVKHVDAVKSSLVYTPYLKKKVSRRTAHRR
jgi:hypothetical protein